MQNYVLGHSKRELRRLMLQADNLRPITARLLREIGIVQGMRVVDLGCGAGDVAMLMAEIVGTTGAVIGIDCNAAAIAMAREPGARRWSRKYRVRGRQCLRNDWLRKLRPSYRSLCLGPPERPGFTRSARRSLTSGQEAQLPSMRYSSLGNGGPFPWCRIMGGYLRPHQ